MPTISVNGARLHYDEQGSGAEAIVFSHGLLMSGRMFDAQVAHFSRRYRCITYDHRGHGRSQVTAGGYDPETLTDDAAALIEALDAEPCHFVGLSMGGFVGMRLAARRPKLIRSLTLMCTSAEPESWSNAIKYKVLNAIARTTGLGTVTNLVMPIMFGRTFAEDAARRGLRDEWVARMKGGDRLGITRAVDGVIHRKGVLDELARIEAPTLVLCGAEDLATVPARSERIAGAIPDARLVVLRTGGHSLSVEEPQAVVAAIKQLLSS